MSDFIGHMEGVVPVDTCSPALDLMEEEVLEGTPSRVQGHIAVGGHEGSAGSAVVTSTSPGDT